MIRLKLDENLPVRLVGQLEALGYDVDTIPEEGLAGETDEHVWLAAVGAGRFLVTQDLDFSDTRRFRPGTHPGLLLVRVPQEDQWRLCELVTSWFRSDDSGSWGGCVVVATPRKVRVRRP